MGNYSSSRGSKTTLNKSLLIRRVSSSPSLCVFSSRSRSSLVFLVPLVFTLSLILQWGLCVGGSFPHAAHHSPTVPLGVPPSVSRLYLRPPGHFQSCEWPSIARFSFQPLCKRLITYFLFQLNQATRVDDLVLW